MIILQSPDRFFFKKDSKLKSRKAIDNLFAKGNSFSNFPFRICWIQSDIDTGIKAGFSATSRNFKKATDRNKIKRLIREAYRLQKHSLDLANTSNKGLHIFFIYIGKEIPTYDIVFEKTGVVVKLLVKLLEELTQANNNETNK